MSFYYLLLGHLLGDFVFQTDEIAGNKGRFRKWNILHACLVTLCILVMAIPFGPVLMGLAMVNGGAHYIIDRYKQKLAKFMGMSDLAGFILDQLLHISLLYLISLAAVPYHPALILTDMENVKLLLVIIGVASFAAVLNQFILAAVFPRTEAGFFARGEKYTGIVARLIMAAVFYLSFSVSLFYLGLLIPAALILVFACRRAWNSWMSTGQLVLKLVLDLAGALAGALLVLFT